MMKTTINTDDFYLAAYLLTNNVQLAGHSRVSNKSSFEFAGDNLEGLLNNYYQDKARISPLDYARSIRSLKALMYSTTIQPTTKHEQTTQKGTK